MSNRRFVARAGRQVVPHQWQVERSVLPRDERLVHILLGPRADDGAVSLCIIIMVRSEENDDDDDDEEEEEEEDRS